MVRVILTNEKNHEIHHRKSFDHDFPCRALPDENVGDSRRLA